MKGAVGVVLGIIVAVAGIAGFAYLTNSHSIPSPIAPEYTCTTTYTTTLTSTVFGFSSQTLQPDHWVGQPASLSTGESVSISFSADNTLDVYVLSSSQYSLYSGGTTSNDITGATGQSAGTLSFNVGFDDTYYVVIFNPHDGFFGLGSSPVGIYSVSGTSTEVSTYTSTYTQASNC